MTLLMLVIHISLKSTDVDLPNGLFDLEMEAKIEISIKGMMYINF